MSSRPGDAPDGGALAGFSEPVRAWFSTSFPEPTAAQAQGWPAIASGEHTLILAPTGSGKTLAAFLAGIDKLMRDPVPERERRTRVLYLSPLRALAVDVEKNLRAPLQGIALAAQRLGHDVHVPTVGMRTGDTAPDERRQLVRHPPDILITTPESLYLMLTSQARETLRSVESVIIDEIHALAPTKRGAHLALSLERLEANADQPFQRIGLSATQRPLDEIARFLGGQVEPMQGELPAARPVTIVDAGVRKELDIEVVVPVEDMGALGEVIEEPVSGPVAAGPVRRSIWPAMHPRLLELIQEHRSTIVFVNSRRLAERLAIRLNELAVDGENRAAEAVGTPPDLRGTLRSGAGQRHGLGSDAEGVPTEEGHGKQAELVLAHHGSLSRERRLQIEDRLKSGDLKGLVATSSLELGIDMGAVDLVVQVESPGAVSRGLQRIGRAGHQVGEPSRGRFFPKHRSDLVEAAVVVERMHDGLIEHTRYVRNPLDVLAQQIVAMCALDDWPVAELAALVRRCANFAELSDDVLANVLDLLAGRYPSEEFAELRPRLVWDRTDDTLRGRAGAQRLAVTSGGTIPDRGLYGVFLPDGTRVGELDEEMVYESRPGETFLLGASTWRIEDITHERVVVSPAPGQPGKMPFWHGDGPGRPLELGRALGQFVREVRADDDPMARLRERNGLDEWAASNLVGYLDEQAEATGAVPDDRTIVVERFRDEIGDWRVCVLSPFGAQVHAPWAMALQHRLGEQWGVDVELMWSDDGIVLRLPEAVDELPLDELAIDPEVIDELIVSQLPNTAMFASRFRECAGRALLLPRRRPDQRTPLWQQRQRSADLLRVASHHPTFPILLEATRECVNDVFDVPALREVLTDLRSRRVRLVPVETRQASPFAQSLLFGWIAIYMYEGDAPAAERRAAALALDRDLLRDLLGAEELRDLIDPAVLADLELELQRLVDGRRARDADEVHDLLRLLGPLSRDDLDLRTDGDAGPMVDALLDERRAYVASIAGDERIAASEDAGRLRDALGVSVPMGLPLAFTDPVDAPLADLVVRYARTHGPFLAGQVAAWLGVAVDPVRVVLEGLERQGRVTRGEFRPDGVEREWCDVDVLRQLRRRCLAVLRKEVEPVDSTTLARFLPEWQGVGRPRRGVDALAEVVGLLQGAPLPASVLEADILPARMAAYSPADLDALATAGEVVWVGAGPLGTTDGRVRLLFRDQVGLLLPPTTDEPPADPHHEALRAHLEARGASFWPELVAAAQEANLAYDDATVLDALWDLVWAGEVTNDSFAPLRALAGAKRGKGPKAGSAGARRRPRPGRLTRIGPPEAAGRWSLVAPLLLPPATPTEAAHARAQQLLHRYGVLTREAALGEGAEGGFAGVYPVLKALEERGHVRRGYFVEGLGAAQFALPGAVDRLRAVRSSLEQGHELHPVEATALVLAATDPAQPYGASLPWPDSAGRPSRSAGAFVVLVDGEPAVFLERGGRSLVVFPAGRGDAPGPWAEALTRLVKDGRLRSLEIAKVDGAAAAEDPFVADALRAAGFADGYRGLVFRA
ncbi:MAG: DEAD/DEAH box helicase [Acidimicrobiales bacterium]|nr:DEAD/DEAH box helicase [Acidimicrobiales bacterium]